jgi:hypothetical protein
MEFWVLVYGKYQLLYGLTGFTWVVMGKDWQMDLNRACAVLPTLLSCFVRLQLDLLVSYQLYGVSSHLWSCMAVCLLFLKIQTARTGCFPGLGCT